MCIKLFYSFWEKKASVCPCVLANTAGVPAKNNSTFGLCKQRDVGVLFAYGAGK